VVQWLGAQKGEEITMLQLSMKTVILCAITRPCRSAELASLDATSIRFAPEGVSISPLTLPKQGRPGVTVKDFFYASFQENQSVCPMTTLQTYCRRTAEWRSKELTGTQSHLFLTTTRPHTPASSATIARWIKSGLAQAGVDTSIFKAHSVRGAATTSAAEAGISVPEILEAADWSSSSTFERYYYRPQRNAAFATAVLNSASKSQVDT
jgi:hypothetical protein